MPIRIFRPNLPGLDRMALEIERALRGLERMSEYEVATVPSAAENRGRWVVVTDEAGGATPAWSDGSDWRRSSDNTVIS